MPEMDPRKKLSEDLNALQHISKIVTGQPLMVEPVNIGVDIQYGLEQLRGEPYTAMRSFNNMIQRGFRDLEKKVAAEKITQIKFETFRMVVAPDYERMGMKLSFGILAIKQSEF